MTTDLLANFIKPIAAVAFAGMTYLAETVTPEIPGVPSWLTGLGLPVAFLVAVIYALVSTNKALRDSENGRRADWKEYSDKMETIMERSQESRERLIRSTDQQTNEFRSLAELLKKSPCLWEKTRSHHEQKETRS